jgi:hypothetical protein
MSNTASRRLAIYPTDLFKELSKQIGELARAMHILGFGFSYRSEEMREDGKAVLDVHSAETWPSRLDFTGGKEEAEGTTNVTKRIPEILAEGKFTVPLRKIPQLLKKIWPLLHEWAPHERGSEYQRLEGTVAKMKNELIRAVRQRQGLQNRVRDLYPPLPETLEKQLREEMEAVMSLHRQAKALEQRLKEHRQEFRQRGHQTANQAENDLVNLLRDGHPKKSRKPAAQAAQKILAAWNPEHAPTNADTIRIKNIQNEKDRKHSSNASKR